MFQFSKSIIVIMVILIMHLYFYNSDYIKKVDYKLYDLLTVVVNHFKEEKNSTYSVVVDIDEKSISEFGQWPWSRIIDAQLINSINNMSPSAIGVNILFPEEDRLSPLSMQSFYERHFDMKIDLNVLAPNLRDNDKLLSEVIKNSNTTLPLYFQNKFYSAEHCQIMSYKNNIFENIEHAFPVEELLCNHPVVQNNVENFGFINAWRDSDGILRRVPLFMKYKNEVFPSFALATLLSLYDNISLAQNEESILVNFLLNRPKVISASDVLQDKVAKEDIQGKIVILGSSVVGLNSSYRIANETDISNSMIHAMLVDNILTNTTLHQPEQYKIINIVLSFFLSFIIFLLLSKKRYFHIVILLSVLLTSNVIYLFLSYLEGIYISMGYLWVSFISFFILLIMYHVRAVNKEQQEQEKFLIRQSKLASMGEMITLIAHQWRQPLSAINGIVLNLDVDYRKQKLDRARFDDYLDEIEGTTAYLSKTISDFTDFFSKDKEAQLFSLSKVIAQAKHLSALSLVEDVSIIHRNNEDIEIKGYASELVQSLLVLLNNAIYICQEKQSIIGEGKVVIDIKRLEKSVIISVEDNGGGVPKKDMKKIFNPYFTTKDKQHGTGLGLYILKLIVEDSMNGKVSLRNGKEGAIFSLEIPLNMK
ncbi:MAG: Two-component sensor histidine kinase [uncultured Sulfurovum sp.]|uniref:histidine kinase n=1 Tax=uncultured Sulfurovum sp. TaxID=269237 RepID=A0A6S6U6F4_9BACT|nr:MAG: Two-component sensor histidine kinase [uncultured Sulfurovum sp.]